MGVGGWVGGGCGCFVSLSLSVKRGEVAVCEIVCEKSGWWWKGVGGRAMDGYVT